MILAFFSLSYGYIRLNRDGMDKECRKSYLKMRFAYTFLFLGIWIAQMLNNYAEIFDADTEWTKGISSFAMLVTGTFLATVRVIVDPFHLSLFFERIKEFYGITKEKVNEQ
jgi:hypothetical protein